MEYRICAAPGTWQLVVLAAAFRAIIDDESTQVSRRDILILYGPKLSDELRCQMQACAERLWNWEKIVWADDLLTLDSVQTRSQLLSVVSTLRDRCDADRPAELWVCKTWSIQEKVLLEAWPRAAVNVFEDGLHTYVSHESRFWHEYLPKSNPANWLQLFQQRMLSGQALRRIRWVGHQREYDRRIRHVYLKLVEDLPLPSYLRSGCIRILSNDSFYASIEALGLPDGFGDESHASDSRPVALCLGQCFALWNMIDEKKEIEIYSHVIEELIGAGYRVLWKDHPRAVPFDLESNAHFGSSLQRAHLPGTFPIESLLARMQPSLLVSGTSSSLIYGRLLFNTPAATFLNRFPEFTFSDFAEIGGMVTDLVPRLDRYTQEPNRLETDGA